MALSLAQRFERRLESLVGTAFARVFKEQVEPVEVASALQREATDKRKVMGNGEVLAPNRYRVTLSPSDHERLIPWQAPLCNSLAELVQEHLDESGWRTIGDVVVLLALDESLHTGVFGVASRMESGAPPRKRPLNALSLALPPDAPAPAPSPMLAPAPEVAQQLPPAYAPAGGPPAAVYPGATQVAPAAPAPAAPATSNGPCLVVDGTNQKFTLQFGPNVVGRGSECDLQLLDNGVSRRHIEISFNGASASIRDLGSTNGTTVNGHVATHQQLSHGDVIRIGHTRLVFAQENG